MMLCPDLVCPECKHDLPESLFCNTCQHQYQMDQNIPLLLKNPDRFAEMIEEMERLTKKYGDSPLIYNHDASPLINVAVDWNEKLRQKVFIEEFATITNCRVLEVGCATGTYLAPLVKHNETFGIDLVPGMLRLANQKGIFVLQASATQLPFKDDYFDAALCLSLTPYFHQPKPLLDELKRVLKPTGKLFFNSPIQGGIRKLAAPLTRLIHRNKNVAVEKKYTLAELDDMLKSHGFDVLQVKTFVFPFLLKQSTKKPSRFQQALATEVLYTLAPRTS